MNRSKYPKEVKNFIISKIKEGCNKKNIYKEIKEFGWYKYEYEAFERFILRLKKEHGIVRNPNELKDIEKNLIKYLTSFGNDKIVKISDLTSKLKCKKVNLLRAVNSCKKRGYQIIVDDNVILLSTTNTNEPTQLQTLSSCKEIVFGVVSDTHFGSKSCQLTALNQFSELMKKRGVKHIFCPGDLVAGYEVYPGQIHDLYAHSSKEQEETTLINLPTGFEWYILGGNHDYSFVKKGGYNIINSLSHKRQDIHYVGFDSVTIPILNNVDVLLAHPSGGIPYSVSYRLQKNIEQITISELQNVVRGVKDKPSIRFVMLGHLHIQMQSLFGSIWGSQCGCFEGQTNYLKRKGLIPSIGGWIVKATLGNNGMLKNFESKFYLFDEIEEDWKNYKHSIPEQKVINPIME